MLGSFEVDELLHDGGAVLVDGAPPVDAGSHEAPAKPPLNVESPDTNYRVPMILGRVNSGGNQTRNVDRGGGATFTHRVCRRDVVVPAWAVIYNERVGLPLTTCNPMLQDKSPSSSGYRVEVESSGGKLVDGLAAVAINHYRVGTLRRVDPSALSRRRKRKKESD